MEFDIIVYGSINMDLTLDLPRFHAPGETLIGTKSRWAPGGKGANQALAAARAGATGRLVGAVGTDGLGESALELLKEAGCDLSEVRKIQNEATGLAVIEVEHSGENRIVVVPGTNSLWAPRDPEAQLSRTKMIILQNEIPLEVNREILDAAEAASVPVLYNPAPMIDASRSLVARAQILVVNETEGLQTLGLSRDTDLTDEALTQELLSLGPETVVLTLGRRGALIADADGITEIPAFPVDARDTTAAGDTYIGYLAAGLIEGMPVGEAGRLASAASALAVQTPGAQPSIPERKRVIEFVNH